MAFNVQQLAKALGKNVDDFAKIGNKKSANYKKVLGELTEEFNQRGATAAKWADAGDFSAMSESQQLAVVNKYNSHMDNMRQNAGKRKGRIEELRNQAAQKKSPGNVVEGKLDGETPQQAYKRQQSEKRQQNALSAEERTERKLGGRSKAEYDAERSKPSKQDIEDARRYRREEIRDNGKTEAARNKAKEDLKRQPQEEAQQVDKTMTREQYGKQRSEERKKTRNFNEQEDGQLSLFDMGTSEPNTTSEYIARETTGLDGKKHTVYDKNKNYKPSEPEYKARETTGLDGEKRTVYDEVKPQESQVKNQETLQANKKTNEVDTTANIDRQAREARVNEVNELNNGNKMERRSLGTWASEIISGTGDETHRISGRKTRAANMAKANADINAANQTYIDTGKGSAQQLYNKNSYWAKVSGEGKKTPDKFNQNDWEDLGKMQNQASTPGDVAAQNSKKGLDWDGIAGWVKENQIVTAAGIAGTALIGASLLDDE